jgi:hypothetical protein
MDLVPGDLLWGYFGDGVALGKWPQVEGPHLFLVVEVIASQDPGYVLIRLLGSTEKSITRRVKFKATRRCWRLSGS